MARLRELYKKELAPKLKEELGLSNVMEIPRITKITLNMGVGEGIGDKKVLESAVADMEKIAGQKAVITKARKSIAGFKVREGWPIGCKVTLRSDRMYEFLDRLVSIAIPRIRDFRGISPKQFDGRGNFSLGVREQRVGPEPGQRLLQDVVRLVLAQQVPVVHRLHRRHATHAGALRAGDQAGVHPAHQFGRGEARGEERVNGGDQVPERQPVDRVRHVRRDAVDLEHRPRLLTEQ